jgi:hypothetical protein
MALKTYLKLCILFMILGLTACKTGQVYQTGSPAEPGATELNSRFANQRGIEGTWEGLMIQGAALTYIRLELSPPLKAAASWHYTGKAYAQSFEHHLQGLSVQKDIQATNAGLQATFNPEIQTFQIQVQPGGRYGRSGGIGHLRNFGGVFDRREDAMAGLWQAGVGARNTQTNSGNQYFLFLRPNQFDDATESFERLQKASGRGRRTKFPKQLESFRHQLSPLLSRFGGPSKSKIQSWVQPLYAEYPQLDLYRSTYGVFELQAIKLFRDDHFKKHFDKPFDRLGEGKLTEIQGALIKLKKSRDVTDRSTSVLERMFWTGRGDNAAMQTTLWVKAQRHMLNWHQDRLKEIGQLPGIKASLAPIDRIEKEVEKIASTLLWPNELAADKQHFAAARQRIALPALKTMLAEFKSSPSSGQLLNRLASWQSSESRLFGYLNREQSRSLLSAADNRLDQVIAALLPSFQQRIATLGAGLAAVGNGNSWYSDFSGTFARVMDNHQVQTCLDTFKQQRAAHLSQAQDEMLARIRQGYAALPTALSKSADKHRLNYIDSLNRLKKKWFAVPGDSGNAATQTITSAMAKLGGQSAALLPPRLAGNMGFRAQPDASTDKPYCNFYRSKVHSTIAAHGILVDNDGLVRQLMPKPIRSAGIQFKSNIVWALFHGRFDELDARLYKGKGIGSDFAADYLNITYISHHLKLIFPNEGQRPNMAHIILI